MIALLLTSVVVAVVLLFVAWSDDFWGSDDDY